MSMECPKNTGNAVRTMRRGAPKESKGLRKSAEEREEGEKKGKGKRKNIKRFVREERDKTDKGTRR